MIERRRSAQKVTLCEKCGAHMRAATATNPQDGATVYLWRCIRCGGEAPRLARRAADRGTVES